MGFLRVQNLVPSLIFIALIVTDQFCWITLLLHLTDKRKMKMARGAGGGEWRRLFEGCDYFYFRPRGATVYFYRHEPALHKKSKQYVIYIALLWLPVTRYENL